MRRPLLALLAGFCLVASAQAESLDRPDPRIVNGVLTSAYPSTGALLRGTTPDNASTWCSGSLIGCSTFLTASHCVEGRSPVEFQVFLPNAGIFSVTSIAQHPDYDFPAGDVAVLKLGSAVVGVAPSQIETTAAPLPGSPGTIVGFGRSGDPYFDYGLKRVGDVVTAACSDIPDPGSDTTSVCWNFDTPLGAPGTDANTCNADSGGPLFVDQGAGPRIAGVTSGGENSGCLAHDHSYDANVFTYRDFIATEAGADLANTTCGNLPQAGNPGSTVIALDGTVSSGSPDAVHQFAVPAGTTLLRVAMNAVDDGPSDFDLYVKAGVPATTSIFDCARSGSNQFAVCQFTDPTQGTWHVLVHRFAGAGTYQLTVTQFATSCAGPGADGTACDDDNPCTTDDACQSSVCTGTAVGDGTPCNDANSCTAPDTCQAGSCVGTGLPNGTACNDGDPCSRPDVCQAGACNGSAPAVGCKVAPLGNGLLALDNRSPDTRDRVAWTLRKGPLTSVAEFGNPTVSTPYTLCLYDGVGGVAEHRLTQAIPPGSRWKAFSRGFRYRDPTLLDARGLSTIVLTAGGAGKSSLQLRGRGEPLPLPALPFLHQPNVTIQLLNDTTCWSSTFTSVLDNSQARFKAKSD